MDSGVCGEDPCRYSRVAQYCGMVQALRPRQGLVGKVEVISPPLDSVRPLAFRPDGQYELHLRREKSTNPKAMRCRCRQVEIELTKTNQPSSGAPRPGNVIPAAKPTGFQALALSCHFEPGRSDHQPRAQLRERRQTNYLSVR